ncbi:MAG: hypothetical protein HOP33_18590 [Verrucomicrobia bacterium]|nr:hypothetical protein [Verrucomicrobiota bacterium]
MKTPKSKHQTPKKLRTPTSKACEGGRILKFEAWDYFGVWCLDFGALPSTQ